MTPTDPAPESTSRRQPPEPGQHPTFAVGPLVVGGSVCAFLVLRGRAWEATLLAAVILGIVQARALSPTFARRFAVGVDRFARALAHGVGWVFLTLTSVVVFMPAAAFTWVLGRRAFGRPRGPGSPGWISRAAMGPSAPVRRTFGPEPTRIVRSRRSGWSTAAGVVMVLMVVDIAAGAVLSGSRVLPPIDRGDLGRAVQRAAAADSAAPALASEPWAEEFAENMAAFELNDHDYTPYIVRTTNAFSSTYINTTDEERVSYRPAVPDGLEPFRVAFFGGSVMFGVGQRDEYTIPSAFARVAEAEGVPVEVHNYGLPGWVAWQEFQYLERLLASGETFDLVVFLDGFNEFGVQSDYSEDPTHHGAVSLRALISDFMDERESEPGYLDGVSELVDAYRRNSAVVRLADQIKGRQASVPGEDDAVQASPELQADAALDIYSRAGRLVGMLVADHGTEVQMFWQPRREGWSAQIIDRLPAGVVDLSRTFDGRDELYFDHVHTNEQGARLLAEAIWAEVGATLADDLAAS